MPLTSKGEKIKSAMKEKYGEKKGEQVFYASKNKGTITGVDKRRGDNDPHLGFADPNPPPVGELRERPDTTQIARRLVAHCDSLGRRLDAFEKRKNQSQPEDVKPRTKGKPHQPHPKEV